MSKKNDPYQDSFMLKFLYGSIAGRMLLNILTIPVFSSVGGWILSLGLSRYVIGSYKQKNKIDMNRFEDRKFHSFNDFFTRRLKDSQALVKDESCGFLAPCDGKASVYHISKDSVFRIKNSCYTVGSLLNDPELAEKYHHGTCLIFRLTPDDYHRYHYIDSGEIIFQKKIAGVLHTVRPIAHSHYPVFTQNSRVCTGMNTERFGVVVQIEVGAMMVGKIVNHKSTGSFVNREEKGYFEFGGSTIILLIEKGVIPIRKDLISATRRGEELPVRAGDRMEEQQEREMRL